MDRPKKGFSIPIRRWLLEPELRSWAESLLDPALIRSQGFLDADAVSRIWKDFAERGIWRPQVWYLLMFQDFLRYAEETARVGKASADHTERGGA